MSKKNCAVCGRELLPREIRINEMRKSSTLKKTRYLCTSCRKREYNKYVKAVRDLVEKS